MASQPAGYNTPPVVAPIGVTVGSTTYGNGPATNLETALDIEMVAAVAQGANINVYFTDTSELGWEAFFSRAIFPPAGENPPSVLSISWVSYFDDSPATIGEPGCQRQRGRRVAPPPSGRSHARYHGLHGGGRLGSR